MPLKSLLKILFSGLLILSVLLVVSVQFSLTNLPSNTDHYQTYQQAAKEGIGSALAFCTGIYDWFVSLDHDDWLALLTAAIAVFTGSLWFSTHRLWQITRDSVQLARDEFNAVHRPRLRVRHIRINPLQMDKPVSVRLEVVNVGETKAHVILSDFALHVTLPRGETLTYQMSLPVPDVHAGESLLIQQEIGPPWKGEWSIRQPMSGRIKISGIIKYHGTQHPMETAFERVYDYQTRRFWPLKSPDPDHEHED